MDIYLIRHTTPAVAKGICYGQTDLDLVASFIEEAEDIRQHLPDSIAVVHSSPLQRCSRLARHLFPGHSIIWQDELKEIHCGQWEMRSWDELPKEELDPWMTDFVNVRVPGGESYLDVHERVNRCWNRILSEQAAASTGDPDVSSPIALVSHGGVIRTILSHISDTPLIDSFKVFPLRYGCVIRVSIQPEGYRHEILHNRSLEEKEAAKPRTGPWT